MKLSALFQQFHVFLPNNASVVQNIAKKNNKKGRQRQATFLNDPKQNVKLTLKYRASTIKRNRNA